MAQTLYTGGTILTMEEPLYAQALLEEDGIIQAVGDLTEVEALAGRQVRRVHLEGQTLIPAFLDPHSHLMAWAAAMLQVPLGDCTTKEEICQSLAAYVRREELPPGAWVKGTGYDPASLGEGCPPLREELDACCPGHPVVIQHASGHAGVFNSLALEQLGVGEETPCPQGGEMGRDEQGRLNGYMEEKAFLELLPRMPMDDPEDILRALGAAQDRYASYGITTVQEGALMDGMLPLYREAVDRGLLKLDVVAYGGPGGRWEESLASHWGAYRGGLKLGGYKLFLDGSPQGRTAWLREPYRGEESYRGYPTMTDRQLDEALSHALERRVQVLAHCNGDGAAEQLLSAVRRVEDRVGRKLRRPVMIHAQLVGRDQLRTVKALGVIPSFFVAHVYHWGDFHVDNLGLERAEGISPAASAWKLGIPFTFHQDTPVLPPDMMETIWCAVNRLTRSGRVLGGGETIPVLEAMKAVTVHAAYQYFEEGEKGSLRRGKQADFAVLERDPLKTPPEELRHIRVQATIRRGQVIYSRGGWGL